MKGVGPEHGSDQRRGGQGTDLVEVPVRLAEAHERKLRLFIAELEERLLNAGAGEQGSEALPSLRHVSAFARNASQAWGQQNRITLNCSHD
jgi:hypothetical protein